MKNYFKQILTKIKKQRSPKTVLEKSPPKGKPPAAESASNPLSGENEKRSRNKRPGRKNYKKNYRQKDVQSPAAGSAAEYQWDASQFKVSPAEGKTRFHDFDLPDPLLHAICDLDFAYCTPIQAEILPSTMLGKDACGKAQTGTGKTAAFLITVITMMLNKPIQGKRQPGTPRVLILAPTRELVLQISEEARQLSKHCKLKTVSIFGGMDFEKQRKQLTGVPVDIIVATPGRLLDFQRRQSIFLKKVEVLIIDEADRMLDMGFIPDVRKIIYSTPPKEKRQTLLFSATLNETITRLASSWTRNPVTVEIEPQQIAVDTVDQIVYIVTADQKFALLFNIIARQNLERVLIFCNRKDEVNRLAEMLTRYGVNCSVLSGDVPQKKRVQRLEQFKMGKIRVVVATDVVARGIHIEGMDHVVNFTLPHDPEDYVHRIGRTGRAGAAGTSISFADEGDAFYLPDIEAFIERKLPCIEPETDWLVMPEPVHAKKKRRPPQGEKSAYGRTTRKPGQRSSQGHRSAKSSGRRH
jgi:ATP-dependent RNA helicase RhlB